MSLSETDFFTMIFCTYCGKSFSRHEHLERHLLTHTDIKPFPCLTCHRSFTRSDLLKRHYRAIHGIGEDAPSKADSDIPRTRVACESCAKHKTKCDQQVPCSRCRDKGWTCHPRLRSTKKRRSTTQSVTTDDSARTGSSTTEHVEQRQDSCRASPRADGKNIPSTPTSEGTNASGSTATSSDYTPSSITPLTTPLFEQWPLDNQAALSATDSFAMLTMDGYFDGNFPLDTYDPYAMDITTLFEDPMAYVDLDTINGTSQQHFDFDTLASIPQQYSFDQSFDTPKESAVASKQTSHSIEKPIPVPGPKSVAYNLACLKDSLQRHDYWSSWTPPPAAGWLNNEHESVVVPVHQSVRSKLTAVVADLLNQSLSRQPQDATDRTVSSSHQTASATMLLPPTHVLGYMLEAHSRYMARYYTSTIGKVLDVNDLMASPKRGAELLVVLMIAQGASTIATVETYDLAQGLLEACRPAIFELVEDETLAVPETMLSHIARLFVLQTAWSGNKWQMDFAASSRSVLSDALELENEERSAALGPKASADALWRSWHQEELQGRLAYSSCMLDQEIALLLDASPSFSVSELSMSMPESDAIWNADSLPDFYATFQDKYGMPTNTMPKPKSLSEIFRAFLDDGTNMKAPLTAVALRLLLQPLQAQVQHFRQLLDCFADSATTSGRQSMTIATTRAQFEDVRACCQQWVQLAENYLEENEMCHMMELSFIIFHLIGLNTITSFQEIERLAKRHSQFGTFSGNDLSESNSRAIEAPEEAIAHCGQILRIINAMPLAQRPMWWAGAVYRVSMVLWTICINTSSIATSIEPGNSPFAVDRLPPNNPAIITYLQRHQGTPCLTKSDGSWMQIKDPAGVLQQSIEICQEGLPTRYTEGVCEKLVLLKSHCFAQSQFL